jgi:cell division septation protein DedD
VVQFLPLAQHAQDDGFHEIQLNGKQLVFLFMAATVVSVVIFLCGVLVGRGVRAERGGVVNDGTVASAPSTEPTARPPAAVAPPASTDDPTKVATPPPTADDILSYPDRLEKKQPKETLDRPTKATKAPPQKTAPIVQSAAPAAEPGSEFTVQIAAYNARGEADATVKRLTTKGYHAYVVPPGNGAAMYRVRVGKFKTRHDAEPVAARLQREESYKPWITR